MKKAKLCILAMAMALSLAACGGNTSNDSQANTSTPQDEVQNQTDLETTGKRIECLPATLSIDNLEDVTVRVSFGGEDIKMNEDALEINVTVYDYEKYDMTDIAALEEGDILVVRGNDVVVSNIERSGNYVSINGGLTEGGHDLYTEEDGVYFEVMMDAGAHYFDIGSTTLLVEPEFFFLDNSDFENQDVIYYKNDFVDTFMGSDEEFRAYATVATIEGGHLMMLTRHYMP